MNIEDRKLMELREDKGISKAEFATVIFSNAATVSKVERGEREYSPEQRILAKRHLDIPGMPLTEKDRATAKDRLYKMRDHVRNRDFRKAREICKKYANLVNLEPVDIELSMLYRLFEVILLLFTDKHDDAKERLDYLQGRLDDINALHQYYFYFNMGVFHIMNGRYVDALEYCKMALDLSNCHHDFYPDDSEKPRLFAGIATCYINLSFPNRAIIYLLKARGLYTEKKASRLGLFLDITLAQSYIMIDALYEAEGLIDSCLVQADSLEDDYYIGLAMLNFGEYYVKKRDWGNAIECFDQAAKCCDKATEAYFAAVYRKIRCLIDAREFAQARKHIKKAQVIYDTHDVYSIHIESLVHCLTISTRKTLPNDEAVNYILTVTIPHYEKTCDLFELIDCYKLLEENFRKTDNSKKALLMKEAILAIHERVPPQ